MTGDSAQAGDSAHASDAHLIEPYVMQPQPATVAGRPRRRWRIECPWCTGPSRGFLAEHWTEALLMAGRHHHAEHTDQRFSVITERTP